MAYDKDQQDFPLPADGEPERKSSNFLPKYFRTSTNKKFLQSTVDQFINEGVVEKVNAFVGRRYAKATTATDTYLSDVSADRENYQFEPSVVYEDELGNVDFYANYTDYLGQLQNSLNVTVGNQSLLNSQQSYSWTPHIDWDKFANFREYYWLPMGPAPIGITGQSKDIVSTYTVETVNDDNNVAYLLTPNGLTRNPTLKLFKEQTYRFEINAPGYPFAFATTRDFDDNDPLLGVDQENNSVLFTDGITKYVYNDAGDLVETDAEYIDVGVIEFVVPLDAPENIYYINQRDVNTSGLVNLYYIDENSEIDVEAEIVGKKTYTSSNGVKLSNGMKVYFQGDATPAQYNDGYYYVEGVGTAIQLINEQDLEVPAVFTNVEPIPFDGTGFDKFPWEDAASFPGTKDYITINRSSPDRNPWSRYNRWFHKDVIQASADAAGVEPEFNQDFRAKRPIIEFEAGLKLHNNGTVAKTNVNLVDTYTKDVFSTIEGKGGYIIDNVELTDGMRILFTADTDPLVAGKIYQVKFHDFGGVGEEKTRQIALIETDDTDPADGDSVLSLQGDENAGDMFHYENGAWSKSQRKTTVNQPPHFDLFDEDGNSFSDIVAYPNSNFTGNKVFSYRVGTGAADSELGFALTYQNIANVGDIVFDFNLSEGEFQYQLTTLEDATKSTDVSFLRQYNKNKDYKNVAGWTKTYRESQQYVVRTYNNQVNNFAVDVFDNSGSLNDLDVKVYVNGIKKYIDIDYTLQNITNVSTVVFNQNLLIDDVVVLRCYSSQPKNSNGFYEIPKNLESNPTNESPNTLTLGEINQHVESITDNLRTYRGAFPGPSNLRDLGNVNSYGTKFLQHSGPFNLAAYHIVDKDANIFKSIDFAQSEYVQFKRQFINVAETLGFDGDTRKHVDLILKQIVKDKNKSFPFFSSDMIPFNSSTTTLHTVEFDGPAYFALKNTFNLNTLSNQAVLVYRNDVQLIHGKDYIFEDQFVYIRNELQEDDEILVIEYESTNGCYVPPTPSKLGLFPSIMPEIYMDDTYTSGPVKMVRGHDGSQTKAYNDYRDDLLLELEKRIYNNTKNIYDTEKLDIHYVLNNAQNLDTNLLLGDFTTWLENAGNPDYSSHTFWDSNNPFTYNYSSMTDWTGVPLDGYWRAIYKKYYETDRPHTHPWEMLGIFNKPEWWDDQYGPAPYTSNNTLLWQDMRDGVIRYPDKPRVIVQRFSKPWLMNRIPVSESGQLLDPLASGIAANFDLAKTRSSFAFGDSSPVETAWIKSSEFQFTLLKKYILFAPTKLIGIGFDLSRIQKDISGDYVYAPTGKRLRTEDLVFPSLSEDDDNVVLTSGFVNYIANYLKFSKRSSYEDYQTKIRNLNNKLSFRLGGFADKSKLKLVLDSRSPLNKTNVFVPEENYKIILNRSAVQETASISGLIIEKIAAGYLIKGYDKETPYFVINPVKPKNNDSAITVGGITDSFVDWNENKTYAIGSIVFYNGAYYRTTATHESTDTFDTGKFSKLADLPITGGISAIIRKSFEDTTTVIPYGTIFGTVQEVVDFMLGYENYLINQGFVFQNVNQASGQIEDMKLVAKEFMFWVTQNWREGTILALSPIANSCTFSKQYYTVDDVFDPFYNYNILTGDGEALAPNFTNIYRENDIDFAISPVETEQGIYLIKLPLVQVEHVVLLDNSTVFNDTIYDTVSGVRQERIKVVGYRTDNWTGNLNIPGFVYDEAKITEWAPYTDYTIGDIVKYKEFYYSSFNSHSSKETFNSDNWRRLPEKPQSELYPNWDYKTNQFADFYDLDTDNFDTEQQRLAQHLIGYQPRQYLANIITDSVSQYKFYQGMIQEKGTKNALTKLFDPLSAADKDSVEFYEEWALRLGQYGSIDNIMETEYVIDESKYKLEPQIVELVTNKDVTRTDLVYEITPNEAYKTPVNYDHTVVPANNQVGNYTYNSGFVKNSQVSFVLNSWDFILEIPVNEITVNEYVWITNEENTWQTYKLTNTDNLVKKTTTVDFEDEECVQIEFYDIVEGMQVDDYIAVRSNYPTLNTFAQIRNIDVNKIIIATPNNVNLEVEEDESTVFNESVIVSIFVKRRFTDVDDLNTNLSDITKDAVDVIWLDDNGTGNWNVYENKPVYSLQKEYANTLINDGYATVFDVNRSNTLTFFGNPEQETTVLSRRTSALFDFVITDEFAPSTTAHDTSSAYGSSVAVSPDGRTLAVGAPLASNAVTRFVGNFNLTGSYNVGDIVSDRGTLWRAVNPINGDGSTIDVNTQDWEKVDILTAGEGTASGLDQQGVVYIYEKNVETEEYSLQFIMHSPEPRAFSRFGFKVELANTPYGSTVLFASAPGDPGGRVYFFEKIEQWKWTRNEAYKGVYDSSALYRVGDIVFYNGTLRQATVIHNPLDADPSDNTAWTDAPVIEHTGYIPDTGAVIDNQDSTLQTDFGFDFVVNDLGDKMAVVSVENNVRQVRLYNNLEGRWVYLQTITTGESRTRFASSIAINPQGDTVAIGDATSDIDGVDNGAVFVYSQGSNNQYSLVQTITSPFNETNQGFGFAVDLSDTQLAIVGKNSDYEDVTTFDLEDRDDPVTVFDNGTTRFSEKIVDAGRIFVYQEINNRYTFGEDVDYDRNIVNHSLKNVKLNNNHIYFSLPAYVPTVDNRPLEDDKYAVGVGGAKGLFVNISSTRDKQPWTAVESQNTKPAIDKIQKVFIYNIDTQDIVQTLDWIDPRQGKIASVAEQEIAFKTPYDPAVYSVNDIELVTVDSSSNWTEKHVGQVWWDISQASWYDPYQGDTNYRTSVFNKLIPGYQIQVCEWVSSKYTPTEWNEISGTPEGYAEGVSGEALYDNTYSVKRVYDAVSQTFNTRYFYWVRNAEITPTVANRQLSTRAIASLIADPTTAGYRFVALLGPDKFALYNCKSLIEGTNSVLHFRTLKDEELQTNVHSEYQMLSQGLDISMPNRDIETKWIDSLVGYDSDANPVPDPLLSKTQQIGVLNLPRQSMFVNRIEAVKQFVERVNWVFAKNQIVDNYNISGLMAKDEEPVLLSGRYDSTVDTLAELEFVGVDKKETAQVELTIEFGVITRVRILNPGRGYAVAPAIEIEDAYGVGAILIPTIDSVGKITSIDIRNGGSNYSVDAVAKIRNFSVLVKSDETVGNIWSIYNWNKSLREWQRTANQQFDTTKYWTYSDWYAEGYTQNTVVDFTIDQSYELYPLEDDIGNVVKINNIGEGGWLLLEKVDNQDTEDYTVNYKTIGRQDGTIQLSRLLYSYSTETSGYDVSVYDMNFYDKEPVQELRNIINTIKNSIFVGDLTAEYNELFFAGLRYAFNEQPNVDWAFKTSFVRAKHNVGELEQKVSYQNDNLENYQDYIDEVKPYKTKIREYISAYTRTEPTQSLITDFDLPPSYIDDKITTSIAKYQNNSVDNLFAKYNEYPFKSWVDNNGYDIIRIDIADGGSGYKNTPEVEIVDGNGTTAQAFVSRGTIKAIEILNKGGKYYKAPTINIIGDSDKQAKAVAILGNSNVRGTHMVVKFDRVSCKRYVEQIDVTETFTGSGSREKFMLKWPMNLLTDTFTITVDGKSVLSNKYTVGNDLDTSIGYERYLGYVDFVDAPANESTIQISYKKSVSLLNASDRIFEAYAPTDEMPGIAENGNLSSLMKGCEYGGAIYDSFGFGNDQGFGVSGFGELPWDTLINVYQDEIVELDGSTTRVYVSQPFENGVAYNVYLNEVRLDTLIYVSPGYVAEGYYRTSGDPDSAIIPSIIGNGVVDYLDIDNDLIETTAGDVFIFRKETSDGSYTPLATTYDTALTGGTYANSAFESALGITAGEVIVDGDDFISPTNSAGPEELVPGAIFDTLDMNVYHRSTSGIGEIGVVNYTTDNDGISSFPLPAQPANVDSVMVLLEGVILDSTLYSVDYQNNTLQFDDSTSSVNENLCIITLGVNGADLIDQRVVTYVNGENTIITLSTLDDAKTVIVFEDGVMLENQTDYVVENNGVGKAQIRLLKGESSRIAPGSKIQYAVYNSELQSYSQMVVDKSFNADSTKTNYHKFTGNIPVPFNDLPLSHRIIVISGDEIYSPGYSVSHTATQRRTYSVDGWQFENIRDIDKIDVMVFVDNQQLDRTLWTWDPVNEQIRLSRNDIALPGSIIDIYIIANADYYFVDTKITFEDSNRDLTDIVAVGDSIEIRSVNTSTVIKLEVEEVSQNTLVVQSLQRELREEYLASDEFIVSIENTDSTNYQITDLEFILSDNITIAKDTILDIDIIQFSNHDINNFKRYTLDVYKTTYVGGSPESIVKKNLLLNGFVKLQGDIVGNNYVWVIQNGRMLSPNKDYIVDERFKAVRLKELPDENDRIDVLQFANKDIVSKEFGYKVFRDITGRTHYKRINDGNSYELAADLYYYDTRIELVDATGIQEPDPTRNIPGIIFIDGERIEYFVVNGNFLQQLRRGTLGTGVAEVHSAGAYVLGQGVDETIDYNDTVTTHTTRADGSTQIVDMDFTVDNINEVEVFVGGRRLRKNAISVFNPTIDQDSPAGDETVNAEFTLNNGIIDLAAIPPTNTEIKVVKKTGTTWTEEGTTLENSERPIGKFLRGASIKLPR